MRRLLWVTALFVILWPAPSQAHHVVSESGIAWVKPQRVVSIELTAATFDFGEDFRGDWQVLTPRLEWAFSDRISASVRVPVAHLHFSDGRRVVGLGDIELTGKYRLVATDHGAFVLSGGLGLALPTGVEADGIGAGHWEVAPFVAASSRATDWLVFSGLLTPRFSLGGSTDSSEAVRGPHGAILAPHAGTELNARLAATGIIGPVYLTAAWDHVFALSDTFGSTGAFEAEVGYTQPSRFRISAGASIPFAGQKRYRWQLSAGAAVFF